MGSSESSDLIRRLQADDPGALEDAYHRFGSRCYGVAYGVLQDAAAAADAVQEAFLRLWQHRNGLVVRTAGLEPWLVVVTRNAALGELRSSEARRRREVRLHLASPDADRAIDPIQDMDQRAQGEQLRRALCELPQEQQQVVELAYFGFLTLSQIADRTQTPLGTVKRRAQRALQRLSDILKEPAV